MNKVVMVTGGTGYVGSWVTKELLENKYTIKLCVRDKSKKDKYQHIQKIADASPGSLEIIEADLLKPGSFDDIAKKSDAIIHIASPFTLRFHNPKKELLDPALQGTKNVLEAATKSDTVKKVVLTSSIAAVYGDNIDMKEQELLEFTEEHFNNTSSLHHQSYAYSKVMAEKEAWRIYNSQNKWKLVVINPSFVMGPALSRYSNSESLNFMKEILNGKFHMGYPDLMFGFTDVRDVALAHRLALENNEAEGRHIISGITMKAIELTEIIKKKYGEKFKLPMMIAPKIIMYLTGWIFGLTFKFISRNVEQSIKINNTKSIKQLGMIYKPIEITIEDMVEQMLALKIV